MYFVMQLFYHFSKIQFHLSHGGGRGGGMGTSWQFHKNVCTFLQEEHAGQNTNAGPQTSHRDTEATSHSHNTGGTVHKRE